MKNKALLTAMVMVMTLLLGMSSAVVADTSNDDYAWVLVEKQYYDVEMSWDHGDYEFEYSNSALGEREWSDNNRDYYYSHSEQQVELKEWGTRRNDSFSYMDMHTIYSWNSPPEVVRAGGNISFTVDLEVLSNEPGGLFTRHGWIGPEGGYRWGFKMTEPEEAKGASILETGLPTGDLSAPPTSRISDSTYLLQESGSVVFACNQFLGLGREGSPGDQRNIEIRVKGGGSQFAVYENYIYEWKEVSSTEQEAAEDPIREPSQEPAEEPTQKPTDVEKEAEVFDSGARMSWDPVEAIGYRLYRSTSAGERGISVTDFYITSTNYVDVNVEPNTTYYYTVKPVLREADPLHGIEEELGDAIATFTVTTGSEIYKPGVQKSFIILQLDNSVMSVGGVEREVDPGRGTTPVIMAGRTMVPIRAIVEAMDGSLGWEGDTQKITLDARGNTVEMWIGSTEINVNGSSQNMDVAPVIQNERTYVPLRFAAENLDANIDWLSSTREVVIAYE